MKIKIKSKNGSIGVYSMIFTVAFLVLILFPLTAFMFERAKIGIVIGEVRKAIDSSVIESYESLNKPFLSQEEYRADIVLFTNGLESNIQKKLRLKNDFSPLEHSVLDGPFTINSLTFIGSGDLPYTDLATGNVYDRPFVEINFTIRLKPMLYQTMITNALGSEYKSITSTRKITLPINN